jgi:predicted DNA-binding protein (UPF0251 family)
VPRPRIPRWVVSEPSLSFYKPRGVPLRDLEVVILGVEEFEALRLSDYEGLYQEVAAREMNISRQTFGRTLDEAHRKVAEAILFGKALRIEGGNFVLVNRIFECCGCGWVWEVPYGSPRPSVCPRCGDDNLRRAADNGTMSPCGRRRGRRGRGSGRRRG